MDWNELNFEMATDDELKRLKWYLEEVPNKRLWEKLKAELNRRQKYDY